MIKCKKCFEPIPSARSEMGYNVCIKCSDEEPYYANVVWPHKTGAWVQPIKDKRTIEHKRRLDRRAVRTTKKPSKIMMYEVDFTEKKTEPKKVVSNNSGSKSHKPPTIIPSEVFISMYENEGYVKTVEYISKLQSEGSISLMRRSVLMNEITFLQTLNRKERKFLKKNRKK